MTILDAYAVIALLRDEPAAEQVQVLLEPGAAALTATGLAEVVDHLVRLAGGDEDDVALDLAQLGLLQPVGVTASLALAAGGLRARTYHRTRCAVSLADCIAAEAARATGRPVATSDPALLSVCHVERIAVVALPDTTGHTWTPPTG